MKPYALWLLCLLAMPAATRAQGEHVAPLRWNPALAQPSKSAVAAPAKKAAGTLSLPFFEDFTDY